MCVFAFHSLLVKFCPGKYFPQKKKKKKETNLCQIGPISQQNNKICANKASLSCYSPIKTLLILVLEMWEHQKMKREEREILGSH